MTTRQRRRSAWMFGALAALLLAACNLDASGLPPPPGKISFPTGVALSREPRPRTLFVANSNFDLSYSAGSVQGYDLSRLEPLLENCRNVEQPMVSDALVEVPNNAVLAPLAGLDGGLDASLGDRDAGAPDAGLAPGDAALDGGVANGDLAFDGGPIVLPAPSMQGPTPSEGALCIEGVASEYQKAGCCLALGQATAAVKLEDVLDRNEMLLDSYASGLAVSPDNRRLYVPISSRSHLVYLDLVKAGDGQNRLSCDDAPVSDAGASAGDVGDDRESDDDRKRCTRGPGRGRKDEEPEAEYPGQPSAIAVGRLGDLGIGEGAFGDDSNRGPHTPIVITAHEQGGLSLYVESHATRDGELDLVNSFPTLESVARTRLASPTSVSIDPKNHLVYITAAGSSNQVLRYGARVLRQDNCEGEGACRSGTTPEAGPRELLYASTPIQILGVAVGEDIRDAIADPSDPSRLFVLTRGSPRSVLFLRLDSTSLQSARVTDIVRVGSGPSKLVYTALGGRPFLLVSAYDARSIFIIDASARRLVSVVRNFSGPFQMAVDEARRLLYVADFRTSVVRVVDLDGLLDRRKLPPRIIATLGALQFTGSLR